MSGGGKTSQRCTTHGKIWYEMNSFHIFMAGLAYSFSRKFVFIISHALLGHKRDVK